MEKKEFSEPGTAFMVFLERRVTVMKGKAIMLNDTITCLVPDMETKTWLFLTVSKFIKP